MLRIYHVFTCTLLSVDQYLSLRNILPEYSTVKKAFGEFCLLLWFDWNLYKICVIFPILISFTNLPKHLYIKHPDGITLGSDWFVNSFIMVRVRRFCKVRLKICFKNNHYKTIYVTVFPGIVRLTFLHWRMCSQGLQFPQWISFCPYFHVSTLHTNVVIWWCKMHHKECLEGGMGHGLCHLSDVLPGIKTCVICVPSPFLEAWQLCVKGPSGSLILGSFWAPCHSTSINVFELFFCCTDVYQYIYC